MELIIRVSTVGDGGQRIGSPLDVIVDIEADHRVSELAAAIGAKVADRTEVESLSSDDLQIASMRTGRTMAPATPIGQTGIASGDELLVAADSSALNIALKGVAVVHTDSRAIASLDVLAGPDAGVARPLEPGRFSVGRAANCDVALSDPTVSRVHLDVTVGRDGSVSIAPRSGVRNPVRVNDDPVAGPTPVGIDDVIAVGGTRLSVRGNADHRRETTDHLGHIEFQRTPYRPPIVTERVAPRLGKVPTRHAGRRFQLMAALAPIAAGLGFFAFSRQPHFLVITLLSPLAMIGSVIEDRRSGRRTYRSEVAAFDRRLIAWRGEVDAAVESERVERLRAAPDLADLGRRATDRTIDLWARGRTAPDFLSMRVGLGAVTPIVRPDPGADGEPELLDRAWAALDGTDTVTDVPITVDLASLGVVGVHGPTALVDGIACSMVIQAACLHSPEDLIIAAAVSADRPVGGWLKWLPHVRAASSPVSGAHVETDDDGGRSLVARLLDVAEDRVEQHAGERLDRRWPWILVLIDADLHTDDADTARLLDLCPGARISVVWLARHAGEVPRQAAAVVVTSHGPAYSALGTIWFTDPSMDDHHVEVEQLRPDVGDEIARALAPLRDASTASLANSIPRAAPLLDVLGIGAPSADWVAANWRSPRDHHLRFPIGLGADGPLVLDLVEHGPHTLIGGTSGAGKSELMQSIVSSLAVHHPPHRLNFLFVDYKGGASSNVFGALPHTVGHVTNLSAELSLRALTSLRAELHRRMHVMEGRAKDLAEMLERHPDDAPPSLVIVVDEFATLVNEVPDFVDGIVDIAQRGRSLGIHLILATQRPSGSVDENILANTNLRISLRMLDRSDSMSVIGSADAADIPVPLKGRAFARLGPHAPTSFQSAFCGAALVSEHIDASVVVSPYTSVHDLLQPNGGLPTSSHRVGTARSHLDAVLDAVDDAARMLDVPAPRRPWCDVLPDAIQLRTVLDDRRADVARRHPGRMVALGMIDVPEHQEQVPAIVDLEVGGGLSIFGSGGAGKTTALRTLATSASIAAGCEPVEILGLDFASRGLASIGRLPTVVDVATGDDLEAVTRHLATLVVELERRRVLLAAVDAENVTAYNAGHGAGEPLSRILVLVDGYGGFVSMFTGVGAGGGIGLAVPMDRWSEMLCELAVEGRQVGIHVVITADRRNAVPSRVHSAIANRVILHHADEQGYRDHGVPTARSNGVSSTPGRGLWQGENIVQIASVSDGAGADAQSVAIRRIAASLDAPTMPSRVASTALPNEVPLEVAEVSTCHRFVLGRTDRTGDPAVVDLRWSNFVVAGGGRSGRSTALSAALAGLADRHVLWGIGPMSSPLDRSLFDHAAFGRGDDIDVLVRRLENVVSTDATGPSHAVRPQVPHVMVIDDLDLLDDVALAPCWGRIARLDDVRVVASVETRALGGYTANPLLTALKRARRMLLLQPDDAAEVLHITGVKSPVRPGLAMVPGRGVLVTDREPSVIQVGR